MTAQKTALFAAAAALLVLLAVAVAVGLNISAFLSTPPETPGREKLVTIEPGATFDAVARTLAAEGIITDADKFRLLGQWTESLGRIKAGEFLLSTGWTPREVLRAITEGRPFLHKVRVVEGLAWWEVGRLVEAAGLASFESFEAAVHDQGLLAEFGLPGQSAEGYLFPDTYSFTRPRDQDAAPLVRAMLAAFRSQALARVWPDGAPEEEDLAKTLVIASMVEKETAAPDERARVAGVYANRLKARMRLQCDPTVIYGLGPAFDGNLTRAHLEDRNNPYNTYALGGLPPGPICSPGVASLAAAARPEAHSFLYFVSRGNGSHEFSKNLTEHNKAVRLYQLKK
jgi:UPF0755 protein